MGEVDVPHEHFWCEKQEQLLIRWAEKAAGYRWLHNHARLYFKKQHDYLSYPSIVIASITGVGGFAVLNPSGNDDVDSSTKTKIIVVQYFFAFLNVLGGILTSISKFSQSANLAEAHSAMCVQYSKFYRNIDMELSLDVQHREDVLEFVQKARQEYDRLLDDAPDIPAISIQAFNIEFPDRENKPDVCNGLSIIMSDDAASTISSTANPVSRWMKSVRKLNFKRRSHDLPRQNSVEV
jgi:hypothetical protein